MAKHIRIVSVGLVVIAFLGVLSGCSILKPSRKALTEANSFMEGNYKVQIHLDLIDGDFVMRYDSIVHCTEEQADWDGLATVYFKDHYFYQQCRTVCSEDRSFKHWRGDNWVATDNGSPLTLIDQWNSLAEMGMGAFKDHPQDPEAYSELLAGHGGEVYEILLHNVPIEWTRICDVHLDSLFGTNERFAEFEKMNVSLLYDTETFELRYIVLSCETENGCLFGILVVQREEGYIPEVELSEITAAIGYPSEEWSFQKEK